MIFNKIGVIGLGFVGGSLVYSFQRHGLNVIVYDKYKDGGVGNFFSLLDCDLIFLCLPTPFDEERNKSDLTAIEETCQALLEHQFQHSVVIKSTVEPETTERLSRKYPTLKLIHNPEFLTARTARDDFHQQKHIVLGQGPNLDMETFLKLRTFYSLYYPEAEISLCRSTESELMKIFCNTFYACKVELFTEFYLLSKKIGSNFESVKNLMLKTGG